MKILISEAEMFVGTALEDSLEKINSETITAQELNEELIKLLPLIRQSADGVVEALGDEEKNKEAQRIRKMAEILERETRFYMERSLDDLQKLEKSIVKAANKTM